VFGSGGVHRKEDEDARTPAGEEVVSFASQKPCGGINKRERIITK